MAGSFEHVDDDGGFRFDLIENMGDAHEACEEMHWLIHFLAEYSRPRIDEALEAYYAQARASGRGRNVPGL